jgi:steroid 5-alpha reductase family enzyme
MEEATFMGLVIIFALITILAAFGVLRAFKSKNFLATFWSAATFLVFGWFVVMTVLNHGIPTGTH